MLPTVTMQSNTITAPACDCCGEECACAPTAGLSRLWAWKIRSHYPKIEFASAANGHAILCDNCYPTIMRQHILCCNCDRPGMHYNTFDDVDEVCRADSGLDYALDLPLCDDCFNDLNRVPCEFCSRDYPHDTVQVDVDRWRCSDFDESFDPAD